MSEKSEVVPMVIPLSAPTVQLRVRIHPGICEFYKDQNKHGGKLIQKILTNYFFTNATPEDITRYITPHEKVHVLNSSGDTK